MNNQFQILQEEKDNFPEEVLSEVFYDRPPIKIQDLLKENTPGNPQKSPVLYREVISLSPPVTHVHTPIVNHPTPEQELEILNKWDATFGRKEGITASHQRAMWPLPTKLQTLRVQSPRKSQTPLSPDVQAILNSAP